MENGCNWDAVRNFEMAVISDGRGVARKKIVILTKNIPKNGGTFEHTVNKW